MNRPCPLGQGKSYGAGNVSRETSGKANNSFLFRRPESREKGSQRLRNIR